MTTRTAIDRRVYRRGQTERADLADEVAMAFRRRFGAQGGAFLRTLEASLANATVMPAEVGDLVATAWGQASAQSSDAGVRRIRAVLLEAQRRGHAEVLRELAEAAGVNVRNRRQYRRFLRSLARGNLTLDQRAALTRISNHVGRLIAQVDDTTARSIALLARRSAASGQTYPELRTALRQRFRELASTQPEHWRARMIGTNEVVQSGEAGKARAAQQLVPSGARIRKRWLSARDERVSDGCRVNDREGWIDNEARFDSGHLTPPRHPRCRCVVRRMLVRRAQSVRPQGR